MKFTRSLYGRRQPARHSFTIAGDDNIVAAIGNDMDCICFGVLHLKNLADIVPQLTITAVIELNIVRACLFISRLTRMICEMKL